MLNGELIYREDLSRELIIIRVKPDAGVADFLPGQYLAIGLPGSADRVDWANPEAEAPAPDKIIKRAYSVASPPSEKGYYEFYISLLADGLFTSRLAALKVGDRLFVAPKVTGTFTLTDVPKDKSLILVSTGTGLAPYISMIKDPVTKDRDITIVHGVRKLSDLAYQDEIKKFSNVKYQPFVSREDNVPAWCNKGRVSTYFFDLTPELGHVFMCGNPSMIEEGEKVLCSRGFIVHSRKTPGNLHVEKYW